MVIKCKPGDWVEIHGTIFTAPERSASLPQATRTVPFEMWIKGFALEEKEVGQNCLVKTLTGRVIQGELTEINPGFSHSFGPAVAELQRIGAELRAQLQEVKGK
ncbi:MAG: 2-amino-4-oxopentanoate thiolase subunit OrtA [Bacillota bacterium]